MAIAEVRVNLKEGVADPEGKNTKKALELLGFKVKDVKVSKVYSIEIEEGMGLEDVEEMCRRLLVNPVIHSYEISIK